MTYTMHARSLHESVAYSLPHVAIVAWLPKITVQVDAVYDWQPLLEQKHLQFAPNTNQIGRAPHMLKKQVRHLAGVLRTLLTALLM